MTNEEIARAAATMWSRCFKCDGMARNLISENEPAVKFKCDKDKLKTCHKWYNGYRTALMALSMEVAKKEEELDRRTLEYVNKRWGTSYKAVEDITDDLDQQAVEDYQAGYREAATIK